MVVVLIVLYYLLVLTYAFLKVLFWYFNVGIVTNERVAEIDWSGITDHDTTTALIEKLQEAKAAQNGALTSFFDFGDVFIETAGEDPNIEFLKIPHPQLVVQKIQSLMEEEETQFETK